MNVLVDTSVWIGHFKHRDERLVVLLENRMVVCHPHIVVEVACGTPPGRRSIVERLAELAELPVATHDELLTLIERRSLAGRGCGFVDVNLLASSLMSDNTLLWTLDRKLDLVASELGRSYRTSRPS